MRKIMKRGFCLFLVAVLLAGLVPYAFADEAKPTDVSEDAAEPTEETTAPPETTVPSESTEPPSEATEPPVTTEATEPDFAIGVVVIICLVLFLGWLMQRGESRAS